MRASFAEREHLIDRGISGYMEGEEIDDSRTLPIMVDQSLFR